MLVLLLLAGCSVAVLAAPAAAPAAGRTIPCSEIIDRTAFPYVGSSERRYRSRLVLGAASVPPAYLEQVSPTGSEPWSHFSKWGMVVRAGVRVVVSVPRRWRTRVGIVWGNAGDVYSVVRFRRCGNDATRGNAYAGGFFLSGAPACFPLRFAAGGRTRVVWFAVGGRCR